MFWQLGNHNQFMLRDLTLFNRYDYVWVLLLGHSVYIVCHGWQRPAQPGQGLSGNHLQLFNGECSLATNALYFHVILIHTELLSGLSVGW